MAVISREIEQADGEDSGSTIPPWRDFAHTGPGTLAGRYLRTFWHPIWYSRDLKIGRPRPIRVMSEDLTLYRGESGRVYLMDFRCAHRGTQLSTAWVEGDNLRCFYHGWMYDGSGQCVDQPAEPQPFCEKIKIRSYPVQEYLGMIFAFLGDGPVPDLPRYLEFEGDDVVLQVGAGDDGGSDDGSGERGGRFEDYPAYRPCNVFNRLENSPDPVHLAFVHRRSAFTESGLVGIPMPEGEETDYGFDIRAVRPGDSVRVTHWHMPNIIQRPGTGGGSSLTWRMPIDDESCMSLGVAYVPKAYYEQRQAEGRGNGRAPREPGGSGGQSPRSNQMPLRETAEKILRGEMITDEITSNFVGIQDWVSQIGQGAIAPRQNDHLGRSDLLVALLRKLWEREMRALYEGRPLKQWHRPARVDTAYGVAGL
jgi:5,5'-dehydrodivanillate O-demethylase